MKKANMNKFLVWVIILLVLLVVFLTFNLCLMRRQDDILMLNFRRLDNRIDSLRSELQAQKIPYLKAGEAAEKPALKREPAVKRPVEETSVPAKKAAAPVKAKSTGSTGNKGNFKSGVDNSSGIYE